MKPTPTGWPRISSGVFYKDAAGMIDWLCDAFGFEVRLKVEGRRRAASSTASSPTADGAHHGGR
jgi:uncharacterized glyoxalase superfamily protein PhnB